MTSEAVPWPLEYPKVTFLDPFCLHYTRHLWDLSARNMESPATFMLQIYLSFKPMKKGSQEQCVWKLENWSRETIKWMPNNLLQLSKEKTEFIPFDTQQQLQIVGNITIKVATSEIKPVKSIRNLGYIMDCYMKKYLPYQ